MLGDLHLRSCVVELSWIVGCCMSLSSVARFGYGALLSPIPPEAKRGASVGSLLSFVRRVPFGGWWCHTGWEPTPVESGGFWLVVGG